MKTAAPAATIRQGIRPGRPGAPASFPVDPGRTRVDRTPARLWILAAMMMISAAIVLSLHFFYFKGEGPAGQPERETALEANGGEAQGSGIPGWEDLPALDEAKSKPPASAGAEERPLQSELGPSFLEGFYGPEIEPIVAAYARAVAARKLLPFYQIYCEPGLHRTAGEDAAEMPGPYERLEVRARLIGMDIAPAADGRLVADVRFTQVVTGIVAAGRLGEVVFEGIVLWKMEKTDGTWKIVRIDSRRERP